MHLMTDTNCGSRAPPTDDPGGSRACTLIKGTKTLVDQHARVNTRDALADWGGLFSSDKTCELVVAVRFFMAARATAGSIGARFRSQHSQLGIAALPDCDLLTGSQPRSGPWNKHL